jgi:hypothetical protein
VELGSAGCLVVFRVCLVVVWVELWVVWVCGGLLVVLGLFLCLEGFSRYGLFEKVVFEVFPFAVIVFPFFPSLHLFLLFF